MSDEIIMLLDMAERMFADAFPRSDLALREGQATTSKAWSVISDLGLPDLLLGESEGGISASPETFTAVLRKAGAATMPVPLLEVAVARWLAMQLGLDNSKATTVATLSQSGGLSWRPVPGVQRLIVLPTTGDAENVQVFEIAELNEVDVTANLAGEALSCSEDTASGKEIGTDRECAARARRLLGLGRAAMVAGGCEAVLSLSLDYAADRVQFGRAIAKFQAVQQQLAVLAEEVAASCAIVAAAARTCDSTSGELMLDIARTRIAEAADQVARIGHQVHGAIGFTREYDLQLVTRRLELWRAEDCHLPRASERIANRFAGLGVEEMWPAIVESTAP